jgi:hypothetical protein
MPKQQELGRKTAEYYLKRFFFKLQFAAESGEHKLRVSIGQQIREDVG